VEILCFGTLFQLPLAIARVDVGQSEGTTAMLTLSLALVIAAATRKRGELFK